MKSKMGNLVVAAGRKELTFTRSAKLHDLEGG